MTSAVQLALPLPEQHRRFGNRTRVRSALADHGWHSAAELVGIGGLRFGARVHELRHAEGLDIECKSKGGASWYRWRLPPHEAPQTEGQGAP